MHNSSDGTLGNDVLSWFGAELHRTIGQGIGACIGRTFFTSGFFILCMAGAGMMFLFGGIGHDLATNKFVKARTVLSH